MFLKKEESAVFMLVRKELKKMWFEKNIIFLLFLITAISFSVLFIFLLAKLTLTGYANYLESQAGSITEFEIVRDLGTTYWAGTYGIALRVSDFTEQLYEDFDNGEIIRKDLFFDCIDSQAPGGPEIYASTSSVIDFNNLVPATPEEIDTYTGCSGLRECAINTYTNTMNVTLGVEVISDIPSTFTYKYDGDNEVFDLGLLKDGSNFVYVTHLSDIQKSYNEEKMVNFQMLLPIREGQTETYYFFSDPNDVCPEGGLGENINANLSGYVSDISGSSLANVSVSVAGYSDLSDDSGYFEISFVVVPGTYNVIAMKEGYDTLFSNVSVNLSSYVVQKNLTMNLETPGVDDTLKPYVYGYVFGESGGTISTAKVMLGNEVAYSDSNGYYSFYPSVSLGSHAIVAIKPSYQNYYDILNFTSNTTSVNKNITMDYIQVEYPYQTGPYTERPKRYDEVPEEVTQKGEDFWISTKEINIEIRKNTFVKDVIAIYNFNATSLSPTFSLSPELEGIVELDKTSMSVLPNTFSELGLTIYGIKDIGEYSGVLSIGGDLNEQVLINVNIVEKSNPIEVLLMNIELFKNILYQDDTLQYRLKLQNLLRDQSYNVNFKPRIRDLNGSRVYNFDEFSEEVLTSHTFLKEFKLPEDIPEGEFVLEIEARYLNLFSVSVAHFIVSKPLYLYSFFGIPLWLMFTIVSFISFGFLNLFLYKRYKNKKKRYSVAVEYSTLPQAGGERIAKLGLIAETKKPAYYELERLTTHAIVAGATGMGKSISAQVLIEEALMNDIAVIVFDPTAQWSGMLRKCTDKKMMAHYPKFGLKETDARAFKGNVRMVSNARQLIDINKYISPGQIQIFSLNKLDPSSMDIFVSNVIRQVFRSDPKESPNLKVLVVFDEVHRLLSKFGGSGEGFLQIERACREFRKWGIGVMLISQVLNDFVGEIKANINTEVQTRTLDEGDLNRIKTKYGEGFLKSLVRSEVGVAMFQNSEYNRGRPYFLNFRPILHNTRRLSDEELEKYNKYNDIIDDIEFQIGALEKEKIDVFDLKMELKLVKDKVMSGNFSVVEIYLEGLKPRIQKEWEGLGKKPPERKIELVSEEEIKKSVEEAKAARKEFEKKEKKESKEEDKESGESKKESKEEDKESEESKEDSKEESKKDSSGEKEESKKEEPKTEEPSEKTEVKEETKEEPSEKPEESTSTETKATESKETSEEISKEEKKDNGSEKTILDKFVMGEAKKLLGED